MKLLAFAASNSRQSINLRLVRYAVSLLEAEPRADRTIEVLDLNDYELPIYSIDRETADGIPALAHEFFGKIGAADGLLISFAEHNGSYTAAFKNLFDWMSRIQPKVYQGTPTVMLSTSPGPGGAGRVLQAAVASAPFFGNDLKAHLSVPSFNANFDTDTNTLTNPELDAQLRATLRTAGW